MPILISSNRPKWPWLTRHFCCLLPRQVCDRQAYADIILGKENGYVNVQLYWFKSVQMSLTDSSFEIDVFHLLVQVHSEDSPTNQGQLEASFGIHYMSNYFVSSRLKCPGLTAPFRLCVFHRLAQVHLQDTATTECLWKRFLESIIGM